MGTTVDARGKTSPAPREAGATLTIGQIARLTGVGAKAIRYYESVGLLPRPPRGVNSYRRYGQADVNRLLLLHRLRTLGTPITAARTVLDRLADETGAQCADVREELLTLLDERLRTLDEEIATLRALRGEVAGYRRAIVSCQPHPGVRYHDCMAQATPAVQTTGFPCGGESLSPSTQDDPYFNVPDIPYKEQSDEHVCCHQGSCCA